MEEEASLSGENGPVSTCFYRQIWLALGLSSFTEAFVQAFSDTHYGAEQISETKHTECRSHVREFEYKIRHAVIFDRFRSAP